MSPNAAQVVERWPQALTDHDLEAAISCFAPDYRDRAPARRGEEVLGRDQVRANFAALFESIPDLRAELLGRVADGSTVWMEWRMSGTPTGGKPQGFVGVHNFERGGGSFPQVPVYSQPVGPQRGMRHPVHRVHHAQAPPRPTPPHAS